MKLENYSFGKVYLDGRELNSDFIIYPDGRIQESWRRASGHELNISDIGSLVDSAPGMIIAGTGASGLMKPASGLEEYLDSKGIRFEALPTFRACELFNEMRDTGIKLGACFHLTC